MKKGYGGYADTVIASNQRERGNLTVVDRRKDGEIASLAARNNAQGGSAIAVGRHCEGVQRSPQADRCGSRLLPTPLDSRFRGNDGHGRHGGPDEEGIEPAAGGRSG